MLKLSSRADFPGQVDVYFIMFLRVPRGEKGRRAIMSMKGCVVVSGVSPLQGGALHFVECPKPPLALRLGLEESPPFL